MYRRWHKPTGPASDHGSLSVLLSSLLMHTQHLQHECTARCSTGWLALHTTGRATSDDIRYPDLDQIFKFDIRMSSKFDLFSTLEPVTTNFIKLIFVVVSYKAFLWGCLVLVTCCSHGQLPPPPLVMPVYLCIWLCCCLFLQSSLRRPVWLLLYVYWCISGRCI